MDALSWRSWTTLRFYVDHPLRLDQVRRDTFLPAMIASFAGDLGPLTAELMNLRS
jgi:hypothetical protein